MIEPESLHTFTCAYCRKVVVDSTTTPQEAAAEYVSQGFTSLDIESVCDDCYGPLLEFAKKMGLS